MRIFYLFFVFAFLACRYSAKNSVLLPNNIRAEGTIRKDSLFEGPIKFYNRSTGKLIEKGNYKNGIAEGEDIQYYENGKIAVLSNSKNGETNGTVNYYDSNGILLFKEFYFHGFPVGDRIKYFNGVPQEYWFHSFDDDILMHIHLDSVRGRKLPDLEKEFFFFYKSDFSTFENNRYSPGKGEYFLYTPHPPLFQFSYSLVKVDSKLQVVDTLQKFGRDLPWVRFVSDDSNQVKNSENAILLNIYDSLNNQKIGMLKRL